MTEYLKPSFTVHLGNNNYRNGWDAVFGPKPASEPFPPSPSAPELEPCIHCTALTVDRVNDFLETWGLPVEAEEDLYFLTDRAVYEASLHAQVVEFHETYGQPIGAKPHVPNADMVALRLKLVIEECCELLEAHGIHAGDIEQEIVCRIEDHRKDGFKVDLVEAADAMADIDYVVEGMRVTYGIDGTPIAEEVHASNLKKLGPDGKPIYNDDGKVVKSSTWQPPDIAGCLEEQGL